MSTEFVNRLIDKVNNESYYKLAVVDCIGFIDEERSRLVGKKFYINENSPDNIRYSIRSKYHVEIYGFKVIHKNY